MLAVIAENCKGCKACIQVCPMQAIELNSSKKAVINDDCVHCITCTKVCKFEALKTVEPKCEDYIICRNCGVKCQIPAGKEGACKRFTYDNGQLFRNRPLQIPAENKRDAEQIALERPIITAVGAGAAYPDYKPAPYIVEDKFDDFDVVTVVTEAPITYSTMMLKIDTNSYIGKESALVRCNGKEVGIISTEQYGSQMIIIGGVNRVKGPHGMTVVKVMADLGNKKTVELKVDDGATLQLTVGQHPVINGEVDTKMRVGCGGACCGLFAKYLGKLIDEAIIIDHHITGLFTHHPAGAEQLPPSGVTPVGRFATPGRYFFDHGEGWGGTNINHPIEAIKDIDMSVAKVGMKILIAETTWRQIALFEVDENGKPQQIDIFPELEEFRAMAANNCEDSKVSLMYYAGVGGSARVGVTVDPIKLTQAVHRGDAVLSIGGAETFVMPGGGITFLADVEKMLDNPFSYTASPAIVAPIEYTITKEKYAQIGGHIKSVRPMADVITEGRYEHISLKK